MMKVILVIIMSLFAGFGLPQKARAYDIDCAIMLCMAGGFPPSAVCARAYRTMIRRITPWPSRPPFGICTYAAVPAALGGPGGRAIAAQFMDEGVIALFELTLQDEEIKVVEERHYKLVPASDLDRQALIDYRD